MNQKSIVWSIGGSDCSGGAGCQADILTCRDFNVHAASIITTITAQNAEQVLKINYCDSDLIQKQIQALKETLPPTVIKLGLLGTKEIVTAVASYLKNYSGKVVCDPVLNSTSGVLLHASDYLDLLKKLLFPHVDLLTPNIPEAEILIQNKIHTFSDIISAAHQLLKCGVSAVLLKGGHLIGSKARDFFTDGKCEFWLAHTKIPKTRVRGTGCALSSAISSAIALGYSLKDAIVVAKMYVQQGIRQNFKVNTQELMGRQGFPRRSIDLPWVTKNANFKRKSFPLCNSFGFYPIVDSVEWVERLLSYGVRTIQLRIKNASPQKIKKAVIESVALARHYQAKLFINDYWKLAIEAGAYGVHLGQEDLETADLSAIRAANLRLGISTHTLYELSRAHAIQPSYVAFGPIYETYSKPMPYSARGLEWLRYWCEISPYPVVAIGGINLNRLESVLNAGAVNVAVISAVTKSKTPQKTVRAFLNRI
ncbi:thiamine phosphate synthase [Coxiella burnetii]|uniref:Thiamine-phosphate synthase n=1 Tax=Coxiella burnetii (strain Dugway 5J108-111) TaxID=434922 RepID=A9KGN3_COXBN|nr:thiamine phosphate synthase [Coxiella burnetii]ABS76856.1 phosphomethylpyrimidine kinase [Coxiella burnetii Dugway 5J108-111]ACJ18952.1 phosphomethylpyrimidine kinase [Coxiella burnetii CbuG_Q212]ATN67308.1 thiamine-phosphate pyrophosphorylase [Coxiella burnetii]OYK79617.1 thiamine phosphate synthase [Coxiella burnetii]OYK81701.1 thiamine phosphate synthase [Coxiella burnetii]